MSKASSAESSLEADAVTGKPPPSPSPSTPSNNQNHDSINDQGNDNDKLNDNDNDKGNDNGNYPNAIGLLRERTQRLATRLQQTQKEMAVKVPSPMDYTIMEQRVNQFMHSYVARSQSQYHHHQQQHQQQQQQQHQQQHQQQQQQQQQQCPMPTLPIAAATAVNATTGGAIPANAQHRQNLQPAPSATGMPVQVPMSPYHYPMPPYMPLHVQLQLNNIAAWVAQLNANASAGQLPVQAPASVPVPPQDGKRKRKCRMYLNREVDALKELVLKLTVINPEVKAHAQQLIAQSDVLCQLDWMQPNDASRQGFYVPPSMQQGRRIDGGMDLAGRQQQQQQQQQPLQPLQPPQPLSMQRQRQPQAEQPQLVIQRRMGQGMRARMKSDVSSASSSSATGPPSGAPAAGAASQQEPAKNSSPQSPRKRNRNRKKRQDKTMTRSLKTELEAMRAYINKIVQQHIGTAQALPENLQFDGDFGDLESHARRLVDAGYGRIVEEEIRVNRKNNRQAFITMSTDREALDRDGIVLLPVARRYAFEGDIVRAFVLNVGASAAKNQAAGEITGGKASLTLGEDEELSEETESQDSDDDNVAVIASDNCPKAFVIAIVKQTELRQIVGNISFTNPTKLCDEQLFYKFRPFDLRMPMVYIPQASCAAHIGEKQPNEVCGLLYLAHVLETDCNGHCIAELVQPVGRVGKLEDEMKAILFHNGLRDVAPFEEQYNEMFASAAPPVTAEDLIHRCDMRKRCVFTIDPLTARDLDDALSIEQLGDDEYEVGVHISDVSHYLQENSDLDNIVKERSTSIYLANKVIHMLPESLCLRCSLLPGEDKFSFSVFWRLDGNGNQLGKPRFTRSVMNSCTQFAYEHAQKIIDNPSEPFTDDDFPNILNGFTVDDIVQRVTWLHGIATSIRSRRFDNGALTINNTKVRFVLDPLKGEPMCIEVEQQREANHMIEEFMLLANQAVARFIYDAFPNIAVLRNHPPPLTKSLKALREKLLAQGLDLDYSSSKALQESMHRLCSEAANPVAMSACLSQLLMKPMARANYFCSEGKTEPAELWHYALSIPIYTHFTSPIRRYPDVMVHRLLAAGLSYCPAPMRSCDELHHLTKIANERKYNAKMAGDDSVNLYFKRYVSNRQAIYMRAVVMEIFQHMLNVVTLESGHVISINYKMQRVLIDTHNAPNFILVTERNMKQQPYKLQLLSVVPIRLIIWDGKLTGFLLTSEQRQKGPVMEQTGIAALKDKKLKKQLQRQQQTEARTGSKSPMKNADQRQQQQQQRPYFQQQQQQQHKHVYVKHPHK